MPGGPPGWRRPRLLCESMVWAIGAASPAGVDRLFRRAWASSSTTFPAPAAAGWCCRDLRWRSPTARRCCCAARTAPASRRCCGRWPGSCPRAGGLPSTGAWRRPTCSPRRSAYAGHLDAVKPQLTVGENLGFWAALFGGDRRRGARGLRSRGDRRPPGAPALGGAAAAARARAAAAGTAAAVASRRADGLARRRLGGAADRRGAAAARARRAGGHRDACAARARGARAGPELGGRRGGAGRDRSVPRRELGVSGGARALRARADAGAALGRRRGAGARVLRDRDAAGAARRRSGAGAAGGARGGEPVDRGAPRLPAAARPAVPGRPRGRHPRRAGAGADAARGAGGGEGAGALADDRAAAGRRGAVARR